jgi:serine/threonine protein kinase
MTCPHCQAGFLPDGARRCPLCGQLRSSSQAAVSVDVVPEDLPVEDYGAIDDLVGAELGALFRIERPLKHGPTSHVYFALDALRGGGRETALKVYLAPEGADAAQFQQAARTAAGLDHPNIARPYRHGTTETLWWYAMDYVPAPSIAERLAAGMRRPLDVPLTWRIALQIASVLDYAHRHGVVHGALKTSDVLLDDAGWVRVVDTGLAQARPVGPVDDQQSFARIVYECLTGAPPQADAVNAAALPADAGRHAAQVLQRALSPTPGHRFPGVLDFVAALTGRGPQALGFAPQHAPPRGPQRPVLLFDTEDPPPPRRRYRLGMIVGLMLGALVLWIAAQPGQAGDMTRPMSVKVADRVTAVVPAEPRPVVAQPPPPPPRPSPARRPAPAPARRSPPVEVAPGYLSVSARPWAMLSIDGRLIGNTPRLRVRLSPGVHQFRLQRAGFKTYEAAVEVKPGETVTITNITLSATTP